DFPVAAINQMIDPLPCSFGRTIRLISTWDLGGVGITINNDGGANYSFSFHAHGRDAGAPVHVHNGGMTGSSIPLSLISQDSVVSEMVLQKMNNALQIMSCAIANTDADNFSLNEAVGIYRVVG
ncbi:unnamed protein product, partial [marine sediment metagenome]